MLYVCMCVCGGGYVWVCVGVCGCVWVCVGVWFGCVCVCPWLAHDTMIIV